MDIIPSEERRVIDELINFYQTGYEPRDLIIHIDRLSGSWGSGAGASFFRQVYEDLHTDKRNKYVVSSALAFKHFLEAEYSQQAQIYAERQAKAKAEAEREKAEREEAER